LFFDGRALHMQDALHARYWNYAIPAAISQLDYSLDGYRGYVSVLMHLVKHDFAAATPIARDELIRTAGLIAQVNSDGVFFFPADEKGLQDFVIVSFALFGKTTVGFYKLYFLLLSLSVAASLLCSIDRIAAQAAILLTLAAMIAVVPALPITSELASLLNPRAFDMLTLPATVSLVSLAVLRSQVRLWQFPLFIIQILLISFAVHIRNATAWQIVLLTLVPLAIIVPRFVRRNISFGNLSDYSTSILILILILFAFLPSQALMQSGFAPEYASQKLSRKIFWHNVGMGFAVSDYFRKKYGLQLSDSSMRDFVAKSPEVEALGQRGRHIFWAGTYTGSWVGADPEIPRSDAMYYSGMVRDFGEYESVGRSVVFRLAVDNPIRTLTLFAFEKPRLLVRQILNAFIPGLYSTPDLMLQDQLGALASVQERTAKRLYPHLLSPLVLFTVVVAAFGFGSSTRPERMSIFWWMLGTFLLSLAPMMVTYPLIHLMASSLTLIVLLMLMMLAFLVSEFLGVIKDRARVFARKRTLRSFEHASRSALPAPSDYSDRRHRAKSLAIDSLSPSFA
jgi:hypothetical protein